MRFTVRVRFERGRELDRNAYANARVVTGDLRIEWVHETRRHRWLRVATVCDDSPGMALRVKLLPVLYSPEIVGMIGNGFSLSGIERIGDIEYAQVWIVTSTDPIGDE